MKDLDTKSRIKELLSLGGSTSVAQRCVSALERPLTIETSRDILANTKEMLGTYSLRVEMHHSVIEGGDDLVNALEKESGENVRLYWFKTDEEEFFIFTDSELTRLIGCMSYSRTPR